jgi:hypothetical protein
MANSFSLHAIQKIKPKPTLACLAEVAEEKLVEEKEGEPNVIESVESNYVTQRRGS